MQTFLVLKQLRKKRQKYNFCRLAFILNLPQSFACGHFPEHPILYGNITTLGKFAEGLGNQKYKTFY